ncbi:hypothetical protein T484DRAFT_1972412 [Baffinella frigidus]|nr:hypothetical protein T484DRAFT_1972412 [Cryptophyta sp. CCMP2293]
MYTLRLPCSPPAKKSEKGSPHTPLRPDTCSLGTSPPHRFWLYTSRPPPGSH